MFQGKLFLRAYDLTSSDKPFRSKTPRKPLQGRSQDLEGGVSNGKVCGRGGRVCGGHAEHGLSRGVWGHAPPEKIWKMASLRLFLVGFGM